MSYPRRLSGQWRGAWRTGMNDLERVAKAGALLLGPFLAVNGVVMLLHPSACYFAVPWLSE